MSFSSYQDPKNVFAVFNHAKQCLGQELCPRPGCIEMKETFPHMENCTNRGCTVISCEVSTRISEAVWSDFLQIYKDAQSR